MAASAWWQVVQQSRSRRWGLRRYFQVWHHPFVSTSQ